MLLRLHDALRNREDELVEAAVLEYGSPVTATVARTRAAANAFLEARETLSSYPFEARVGKNLVVMEPVGVVGALTPFNADYGHICSKLAPAIAAGCTMVVKPSENNGLETELLCRCFQEADIPPGVVNVVEGRGEELGPLLCGHPDVAMINFTGSTRVGKEIAALGAGTMKRFCLELGGKSPNIILDDTDIDRAAALALVIGFSNSGQACHAGTRLLVPENRLNEMETSLKREIAKLKIGHLGDADSFIGPLVSRKQFDTVQSYIQFGMDEGAELLAGGPGHPEGLGGYYARPTIFTNVSPSMRIAREEIFGPVISLMTYENEDQAVEMANDTKYGLAAFISSADSDRAERVARRIRAGMVVVNDTIGAVVSGPVVPIGGMKESGLGRAGGRWGLEAYLESKVIA
jgi:aldehyde dehydrogenase (NAD+)